jgi:type IV pilus assembly protein PilZ
MLLSLMDEPVKLPIAGSVVWVTPAGAQNNKTQGIGVQFSEDESGQAARHKIETILAGYPAGRQTHTI